MHTQPHAHECRRAGMAPWAQQQGSGMPCRMLKTGGRQQHGTGHTAWQCAGQRERHIHTQPNTHECGRAGMPPSAQQQGSGTPCRMLKRGGSQQHGTGHTHWQCAGQRESHIHT